MSLSGRAAWVVGVAMIVMSVPMGAQGTKQWTVSRYDEITRGTLDGVTVRSDGRLEAGSRATLLTSAGSSYVWSVVAGEGGTVYAGLGGSAAGSAAVLEVGRNGQAKKIFSGPELAVQSVRRTVDGTLYAVTSPEGKVYRLTKGGGEAAVVFDSTKTAEKPKYLWDMAVAGDGTMYVAAGAPAVVYRVSPGGKAEVLFRTADQHIRSLLLAPDGTLWAGSDGAGVIYRIATGTREAKPFAVYAAERREITALARDGEGRIYAAAVGAKSGNTLQPLPVTGNVGVTVTFVQPGSSAAAGANTVVPEGSEIDRIDTDGTPERVVVWRDEVVYALTAKGDDVFAATGNRGRLYRLDAEMKGRYAEVARLEASQMTALAATGIGLLAGTSNGGSVFSLGETPTAGGTYTSEVFDAGQTARWGRVEVQGADSPGTVKLALRTGNVPNPISAWSEWTAVDPAGAEPAVPAGRYAQWRAVLDPSRGLGAVSVNYLPRNVAPVVDELVVAPGTRVAAQAGAAAQNQTVQVVLPTAAGVAQAISLVQDAGAQPLTAQRDRMGITARWSAHDDNGDDLMFALYYRGTGERSWRLLKDKISDRFYSFDAALVPDGEYTLKVVASDAPVHVEGESRTGERVSAAFVVDTTPPVPGVLRATLLQGTPRRIHATFDARDQTSPIAHAEYSVDAGPWQYLEPVGGLSDALAERYDWTATLPVAAVGAAEHVIAVRVYDRYENMASAKAVVR